jgi:hypothetical protein
MKLCEINEQSIGYLVKDSNIMDMLLYLIFFLS